MHASLEVLLYSTNAGLVRNLAVLSLTVSYFNVLSTNGVVCALTLGYIII